MKQASTLVTKLNHIFLFEQRFPSLLILPKIHELVIKGDPTLGEVVNLCKSNSSVFEKLTHLSGGRKNERELAKEILFKKGMNHLYGIGIRAMNQEIFSLPLSVFDGLTEHALKRRSIILARYLRSFSADLSIAPDEAYLCGLFYNFRIVCFELLLQANLLHSQDFETEEQNVALSLAGSFCSLGFQPAICDFLYGSVLEIHETENPFLHALVRIGDGMLTHSDKTGRNSFRNVSYLDARLIEATGMSVRQLTEPMKEQVKGFKGGINRQ